MGSVARARAAAWAVFGIGSVLMLVAAEIMHRTFFDALSGPLVWAVFGFVGDKLGGSRGRPVAGLVLGLCLGPIGWLLVMNRGEVLLASIAMLVAIFGCIEGLGSAWTARDRQFGEPESALQTMQVEVAIQTDRAERSAGYQRFFGWATLAGLAGIWLLLEARVPVRPRTEELAAEVAQRAAAEARREEDRRVRKAVGLSAEEAERYQAAKARMGTAGASPATPATRDAPPFARGDRLADGSDPLDHLGKPLR